MDRIFRIDFYPQDWLIDTARLTNEERGVYIQIVMMIYSNRGPIPDDEKHLANICNCSTRMVRSVIKSLFEKGFIQITGSKITQKRAELELNIKRTHLERSSKGGRNRAENQSDSNNNNDLTNSGGTFSLDSPVPVPVPDLKKPPKVPLKKSRAEKEQKTAARGSLKNGFSGGEEKGGAYGNYRVENFLSEDAWLDARSHAPGWDVHELCKIYNEGINSGKREKPHKANKAFPLWCKAYTKGRPP